MTCSWDDQFVHGASRRAGPGDGGVGLSIKADAGRRRCGGRQGHPVYMLEGICELLHISDANIVEEIADQKYLRSQAEGKTVRSLPLTDCCRLPHGFILEDPTLIIFVSAKMCKH